MRLDKFLSTMGLGTRTEVKQLIKQKQVLVNGTLCQSPKEQIDENTDVITVGNEVIQYKPFYYYVMNKPAGVITATEDKAQRTVMDLLTSEDCRRDLFPVGRLDKDTTGLLVLTNDGVLAHELLAPKKHIAKVYEALVQGVVTEKEIQQFAVGLTIDGDEQVSPAQLEVIQIDGDQSLIHLTIHEGKFHQVKRMFKAVGMKVLTLHRLKMGDFSLPNDVPLGKYRPLTHEEEQLLIPNDLLKQRQKGE